MQALVESDSQPGWSQTKKEEVANALTHGVGLLASLVVLILLVVSSSLGGDTLRIVTLSVYGACLVLLYLSSTLYHAVRRPKVKHFFRVCDHIAIYLLIAGTYTPFVLVALRGPLGWSIFGVIWGLAAIGIGLKVINVERSEILSLTLYLAMGWLAVLCAQPLASTLSVSGLVWVAAGGAAYTFGVVFYLWEKLPFNHAIWHVFVLGGSTFHLLAIWQDVLPIAV